MKYWEIITDNLSRVGWSWGCVSAVDAEGRTIWIADAHRGNGKGLVVLSTYRQWCFMFLILFLQKFSADRGVVRPHVPISLSK